MTKKTIFSLISLFMLCLMLSIALFFNSTAEGIDLTVYISSAGAAGNSGLAENEPVSTLAEALAVANGETASSSSKVRFVLLGDISVENDPYGKAPFPYQLSVSGKTGNETLNFTGTYIHHVGDTTYENMHFAHNGAKYSFLCGNGHDLVLGKGLTCTPNSNGYYLNLAGGIFGNTQTTFVSDSSLTVLSGEWETLYAGSYNDNQKGDATLYAENCKVYTNVGTCFKMSHDGNSAITLKSCDVGVKSTGMLQGGPTNSAGSLTGKLTLTVEDCTVGKFGVGYKRSITAPLSLTVKNSTVKDAYSVTATGEQEINLFATQGKTLDLSPAEEISATTFTGGGTLVLGEKSLLKVGEVIGSTSLSLGDSPAIRTYVRASASTPDEAFTYSGTPSVKIFVENGEKVWTFVSPVILKAPESITFTLVTGFKDGSAVTPTQVYTEGSETFYVFYSLSPGEYRYDVKGSGYYHITKNLLLTDEKLKSGFTLDCTPPKIASKGFQPSSSVKEFTDEMRENLIVSDSSQWPEYSFVFQSPYFTRNSYETGMHQATTQDEMMAYLERCVEKSPYLYLFSLGKSPVNSLDIPIVIYTASDLSKAKTLKEAAEIVCANGKLNFQYQAQVHGNETAAGEGALAMIGALSSNWGEKYLSDMNICIIPRINTDGSQAYTRAQVSQNRNLNRDYLLPSAEEVPMILQAYNLFQPQVVVDGHEFTVNTGSSAGAFNDVLLGTSGNESIDGRFEENGAAMMLKAFESLGKNHLEYNYYTGQIDSIDPTTARGYYQMRGSVSLLIETNGINAGQFGMHRRVISQFLTVEAYFNYAKEHKDQLRALSAEVKEKLVQDGSSYDADRLFALQTQAVTSSDDSLQKNVYDYATGLVTGTKKSTPKSLDDVQRSRPLPTAYVIPKDENASVILRIADAHGISYYELEKGSSAYLYGYNGSYDTSSKAVTNVSLSEESLISFPGGAYVFPMNQNTAMILASMFEPDNDDIYAPSDKSFTLAQQGTVPYKNGSFAMYRSQRNLTNGKIEVITAADAPTGISVIHPQGSSFTGSLTGLNPALLYEYRHENETGFTPVPAGSTEISGIPFGFTELRHPAQGIIPASKIVTLELLPPTDAMPTVYLAPQSGSDTAFGTENAPVKSIDRALILLNVLNRYSKKQATLIFTETLTAAESLQFPDYDYPLYITSKSGAEGITCSKSIFFSGETVVDDFTFTHTTESLHYIIANGHKLTLGEKVRSVADDNYYYMPVGGGYSNSVESTDMTVLGGTWRNIYVGSYKSTVAGNAKLVAKNCTVIAQIQTSFSGKTLGNVTIDLENVTVQKSLLCGNADQNDVMGDVTLTAKNCNIAELYAGSRDTGNVVGKVRVTLISCTAGNLLGKAKNDTGTVGESHLTLISTTPTGTVEAWTSTKNVSLQKGDFDLNGEVNADDAVYLLYHVVFPRAYPVQQSADLNGDGKVDTSDALYLLYHVNFPENYPLS